MKLKGKNINILLLFLITNAHASGTEVIYFLFIEMVLFISIITFIIISKTSAKCKLFLFAVYYMPIFMRLILLNYFLIVSNIVDTSNAIFLLTLLPVVISYLICKKSIFIKLKIRPRE